MIITHSDKHLQRTVKTKLTICAPLCIHSEGFLNYRKDTHSLPLWTFIHLGISVESGVRTFLMCMHAFYTWP